MPIHRKRGWELPETLATPEHLALNRRPTLNRRNALKTMGTALGATGVASVAGIAPLLALQAPAPARADDIIAEPPCEPFCQNYPPTLNARYTIERPLTPEHDAATYCNFYEYGSHKSIHKAAQALNLEGWTITIDGLVDNPKSWVFDDLFTAMQDKLEQRTYRHRCVEAWAMTVPWDGFPLSELVALAQPKADARYVRFYTTQQENMPGLKTPWWPWPYTEGITIKEATNELAFIATGMYGKPLRKQNGAPIRLVLPWKYGFKSIKSIDRIEFTAEQPQSFWQIAAGREYGFWANVNPDVPHPRWSQKSERLLGSNERVPTRLFNGYGEFVAPLYADMKQERILFF